MAFPAADGRALRIDTWVEAGCEIPPYFDPMIAKVIACAPTRDAARDALDAALAQTRLYGVETNRDYLRQIPADAPFSSGSPWTRCLETLAYRSTALDVLSSGTLTTVQDWPGRQGYWAVGVPPSGPMDDRALRLGNRLLGNAEGAAGLEITMSGPRLRFRAPAVVAVTGARLPVLLDGAEQPMDTALFVPAGATLTLGAIQGAGVRSYLPCAAACNCRITWAARAPSPWASSAVTAAGRCGPAMSCTCRRSTTPRPAPACRRRCSPLPPCAGSA